MMGFIEKLRMKFKEKKLKKEYEKYLKSFPENKKVSDESYQEAPVDDIKLPYNLWIFENVNPETFRPFIERNLKRNREKFALEAQYVSEGGHRFKSNPIYEARGKVLKDLRKTLKTYTGRDDEASDIIFMLKQQSDMEGREFTDLLEAFCRKVRGEEIIYEETQSTVVPIKKLGSDQNMKELGLSYVDIQKIKNDNSC